VPIDPVPPLPPAPGSPGIATAPAGATSAASRTVATVHTGGAAAAVAAVAAEASNRTGVTGAVATGATVANEEPGVSAVTSGRTCCGRAEAVTAAANEKPTAEAVGVRQGAVGPVANENVEDRYCTGDVKEGVSEHQRVARVCGQRDVVGCKALTAQRRQSAPEQVSGNWYHRRGLRFGGIGQ
jgi:hypothetical protein